MLLSLQTMARWDLSAVMATMHEGRVALWSWHPGDRFALLDPLARRMWGNLDGERHSLDTLFERVHPDDREATIAAWMASAESDERYEFDFRIGTGADAVCISARGVGGAAGRSGDEVLAIFVDVTRLNQANEARERLIREMAHRTSNLFTVAQSMTRLSANEATDVATLATDLERRFTSLAGAYRFAVTQAGSVTSAPLGQVAEQIIAPFSTAGAVEVDLPAVDIQGEQVTNLAIVLHELTTNAVKYGALSAPGGRLVLRGDRDGETIRLTWREEGGPHLTAVPPLTGSGTRLIDYTITAVFGGTIQRRVENGNMHVDLTLDANRLAG